MAKKGGMKKGGLRYGTGGKKGVNSASGQMRKAFWAKNDKGKLKKKYKRKKKK